MSHAFSLFISTIFPIELRALAHAQGLQASGVSVKKAIGGGTRKCVYWPVIQEYSKDIDIPCISAWAI
jgi:hypothetical protein